MACLSELPQMASQPGGPPWAALAWPSASPGHSMAWGACQLQKEEHLGRWSRQPKKCCSLWNTKQNSFLLVPREVMEWRHVLDLNQEDSLLEVISPLALAGGWRFQKANWLITSKHTAPGPDTALGCAGVSWINQVALSSPCCLWDQDFL